MTFKNWLICGNCRKSLGFRLGSEPISRVYCFACEDFVTHNEEQRETILKAYREALSRQSQQLKQEG